jgi:2-polyprenyl-6-methoxyphenol hydroxylase-like FAD-dependent oxidoreductase
MDCDVVVVGAGPTGLMLATELGLAGVSAVVVERLEHPSMQSKGGGVQPRTAEVFDLRGMMEPLLARALPREPIGGHFAGLPVELDCRPWRTRHLYPIGIPQASIEEFLADRARRHGIPVRRGHEVAAVHPGTDGVRVAVRVGNTEHQLSARYLVACDGAHSTVRQLLGMPFPGDPGTRTSVVADIALAAVSATVPTRAGQFASMVSHGGGYWTMLSPLAGGRHRLVFGRLEPGSDPPRDSPVTAEEVGVALRAVHGPGTRLGELLGGSRFSDAARQLEQYRAGRVLFAGDAAHIHSPLGGQGLNLGIQDAVNLGWKLAVAVQGRGPGGLLDSYHDERHPVAARVLRHTRAQRVLAERQPTADVAALREIVTDLVRLPDTNRYLAGLMSGLDLRYPMPDGPEHPLAGARMPDLPLTIASRQSRVSDLMHDGHAVLLDLAGDPALARIALPAGVSRWRAQTAEDVDVGAVLIRPDGHICWVAPTGPMSSQGMDQLDAALRRWFTRPGIGPGGEDVGAATDNSTMFGHYSDVVSWGG